MTAMDAKKVPEALLRSGRIELWLETKLPDEATRMAILQRWIALDLPGQETTDYALLGSMTAGFTPADLRRLAADAKVFYAADVVRKQTIATATDYMRMAIEDLVGLREKMAERMNDSALRIR